MKAIPVERHILPNGLRLVHSPDTSTAMVAVDVLYDVGARDESRHRTGIAHLFEHLMFGGSRHVKAFDKVLEGAGGQSNAWTSNDFTNFYDTLPAQNIDTALYLESDRMLAPSLTAESLEIQRSVVIEEFKQQCLDRPYGDLYHHLRRLVYADSHPYSWPVIGIEPQHVADVSLAEVKQWFEARYAPNNAILAITGNISFDEACRRAEAWFADVPARPVTPRPDIAPGFPTADVIETTEGPVPYPLIVIAFPMSGYGTSEYFTADTITDILSAGRSARLPQDLVNGSARGLISDADASIMGSEGPGFVMLTARVTSNDTADIELARKLLLEEVRRLGKPGSVGSRELERTLNNFEATHRFANAGYLARATNLAMAELHGEDINRTADDRRLLTPADISTTAAEIFARPCATLIYRPA